MATVRAMARFTEPERERGMDMLQAAEGTFVELGAPSRLGTALFSAVIATRGVDSESPAWGVAAGVSLMGYACRMAEPGRDLPDDIVDAIEGQLVCGEGGELDYEAIADDHDRLAELCEFTATLADDQDAIAALAAATPGAWQAFATTAAYQLHTNLVRNGLPKQALPSAEALENLLRLGYAIRLVDEVVGEEPIPKYTEARDLSRRRPSRLADGETEDRVGSASIDVDAWLSDAARVCVNDFEPFTERLLELATLERLGILSVMDRLLGETSSEEIGDDVITAIANARMGYALRNRETQVLDHTQYVAPHDALANLLDDRVGGDAAINLAVVHGVLRDVLVMGFLGGRDALYESTPGAPSAARRQAIGQWANRHFSSDDPRTGRDVTVDLLEYGYFLHRLFEIRPECLEDWS